MTRKPTDESHRQRALSQFANPSKEFRRLNPTRPDEDFRLAEKGTGMIPDFSPKKKLRTGTEKPEAAPVNPGGSGGWETRCETCGWVGPAWMKPGTNWCPDCTAWREFAEFGSEKASRKMSGPALNKTDLTGFTLHITGIVHGGKNSMGVTKKGKHYARPLFKRWRDDAVNQIRRQLTTRLEPIATPVNVRLAYVAGDKRRRDFPAICDALWHVLEKAGVVADDTLLWPAESTRSYDKANPSVTITFL